MPAFSLHSPTCQPCLTCPSNMEYRFPLSVKISHISLNKARGLCPILSLCVQALLPSLCSSPAHLTATPSPLAAQREKAASAFCLTHVCSHIFNPVMLFMVMIFNPIRCNVPFYNKCYVILHLLS